MFANSLRSLIFLAALVPAAAAAPPPAAAPAESRGDVVMLAEIKGVIGPATLRHVEHAVEMAETRGAEALILQIDTPGGLVVSTRAIIESILASDVPVIGYVAPAGGHAASAGTYILYATHVAAMAPGTNVGAATPIQMGGSTPLPGAEPDLPAPDGGGTSNGGADEETSGAEAPPAGTALDAKSVNDAVAQIRALAELRGRNAEWAERAVREAVSLTANGALDEGVVEFVAADVRTLLVAIDGETVRIGGQERTLATAGLPIERIEPTFLTQALGVIANPNVAFLLMLIGVYGLIYEFATPGSIGPGVIGAIALILGLYALHQLPLNYAGLALIALGLAFMVAEAFSPTFGVLGLGGLVAFVVGAFMLFDTDVPAFRLNASTIVATAASSGLLLIVILGYAVRALMKPVATGIESLSGKIAQVVDWSGAHGHVWVDGERWEAVSDAPLTPGQEVRVVRTERLKLHVAAA